MLKLKIKFYKIFSYYSINKSRIHRLSKEGIWIILGQILSILGGFILLKILTYYLDPTEYGKLSLSLTIAGLISLVFFGGINNGISRFYSIAYENKDILGYVSASNKLLKKISFIVIALGILITTILFFLKQYSWVYLVISAIIFAIFSSYSNAITGFQNAARQRSIVALNIFLDSWIKVLLAIFFFLFYKGGSLIAMLVNTISSFIVTLSQFFFLKKIIKQYHKNEIELSHDWSKRIWSFSWPFYATNLFGWAQQSSGRWFLEEYGTKNDVGLYSVISQLGFTPIQTATSFLLTFLTPIFFSRMGDGISSTQKENVRSLTNKLTVSSLILIGITFVITLFFHEIIFKIFVNEKYYSVSNLLPWMILSGGFFAVAQIYAIRLQALFMMDKLVFSGIFISIAGVLYSYVGIKFYSISGGVIASLLFSITYFTLMLFWFYKKS